MKIKTEIEEPKKLKKVEELQIIVNDIIFRLNNAYQLRNPIEIDNVNKETEVHEDSGGHTVYTDVSEIIKKILNK